MTLLYKYSESELKQLLKSLTVIVDTREKENKHIIAYFEEKKIKYIEKVLKFGDYSYMLPTSEPHGISRDIYFTNSIAIERKASLEELSGNFAHQRDQFENEFLRAGDCDMTLLIEQGSLADIITHKYNTKLSEQAFIASLLTWEQRFNVKTAFVHKNYSGAYIYGKLYYHLKEFLRG